MNAVSNERGGLPLAEFERPEMRAALGSRDITRVFRLLQKIGLSQQRIAALTGQSQPEVSAIIHGRRVMAYDVLARIADGLGVPREYMGLSYGEPIGPPEPDEAEEGAPLAAAAGAGSATGSAGTAAGSAAGAAGTAGWSAGPAAGAAGPLAGLAGGSAAGSAGAAGWSAGEAGSAAGAAGEESDGGGMGRRTFLGQAAAITMGAAVLGPELGDSSAVAAEPVPVPSRVGMSEVNQIRDATASLRALDYLHGGGACRDAAAAQLSWAERLLRSDASAEVGRQLRIAVADLRNLVGWTSLDLGHRAAAEQHFLRALNMAKQADAHDLVANVLYRTGRISLPGQPDESVRVFRLAEVAAQDARSPLTNAILASNRAWALGMLGDAKEAHRALGLAEEELAAANLAHSPAWARFFDESDLAALQGMTFLALGDYSPKYYARAVERLEAAAERRVPEMARSRAFDLTALAVAHYKDGDVDHGTQVAHVALDAAGVLKSARAIDRLRPLAEETARRSDAADARDLGERVAATVAAMSPAIAREAAKIPDPPTENTLSPVPAPRKAARKRPRISGPAPRSAD